MEGGLSGEEYVMYEIPADQKKVTIIPLRDNADFIYMDREYSFGSVADDTRGELTFATMTEGAVTSEANFRIYVILGDFYRLRIIIISRVTRSAVIHQSTPYLIFLIISDNCENFII